MTRAVMTGDTSHHVAGDIVATTALAIGNALAAMPGATIDVSSEVKLDGVHYGFEIYPTGASRQGGNDFLVGGNVWLPLAEVRAFLQIMAEALERAGIVFQLELVHDGGSEAIEHPRYRAVDGAADAT